MESKNAAVGLNIGRLLLSAVGFATVFAFAGPRQALAQNLVQDPNFFDGLADYQTTGNVVSLNVPFGPTPPNGGEGTNTAVLYGPGVEGPNGAEDVPATVSQAITTVPNTVYLVTFSVNFDPGTTDALLASFGNGTFPLNPTVEPDGLATYSFTGKATGTSTDLTFAANDGAYLITEL
jgi:hypothetical protein